VYPAPGTRPVIWRLSLKLLDAGTSIGANIEEGRAGQTKPDFIAKHFISLKESREPRFWLWVIAATDPPLRRELQPFLQEANEFIAMLTTSLKNARLSQSRGTQNPQ
jgi:four helix bundle protein